MGGDGCRHTAPPGARTSTEIRRTQTVAEKQAARAVAAGALLKVDGLMGAVGYAQSSPAGQLGQTWPAGPTGRSTLGMCQSQLCMLAVRSGITLVHRTVSLTSNCLLLDNTLYTELMAVSVSLAAARVPQANAMRASGQVGTTSYSHSTRRINPNRMVPSTAPSPVAYPYYSAARQSLVNGKPPITVATHS